MSSKPGVFDVTDTTYDLELDPKNAPSVNTDNLQGWVNLLLTPSGPTGGNGGTLQFPSIGTFQFNGPIYVGKIDSQGDAIPFEIIFMGTGQGQQDVPILEQTVNSGLFVVETNDGADRDIGGTVFPDLLIKYTGTGEISPAAPPDSAIHVRVTSQSVRLERVTLVNWPRAVFFDKSYRCSMAHCTVHNVGGSTLAVTYPTIGVQLGDGGSPAAAIETYIADCLFLDDSNSGIAMQVYGCEHLRVMNCRLEGWAQGILITPAVGTGIPRKLYFCNVTCFPNSRNSSQGAALLITTAGSTPEPKSVTEATFAQCDFSPPSEGTAWTGAGVIVGSSSAGPEDAIDQIRFVDCHVCLWNGPGLNIVGGTNIEVLGGCYSCNGIRSVPHRTGIAFTGAAIGVRITGAACNNSLYDINLPGFANPTQRFGIEVTSGAASVLIDGCDLTGNLNSGINVNGTIAAPTNVFVKQCDFTGLASPVAVTLPVANLQVRGCPGYNDQGTIITSSTPALGSALTIAQLGSAPHYYGPGECYVDTAGADVKINDQTTHLKSGSFYLEPLETIEIDTSVSHFVAIGK